MIVVYGNIFLGKKDTSQKFTSLDALKDRTLLGNLEELSPRYIKVKNDIYIQIKQEDYMINIQGLFDQYSKLRGTDKESVFVEKLRAAYPDDADFYLKCIKDSLEVKRLMASSELKIEVNPEFMPEENVVSFLKAYNESLVNKRTKLNFKAKVQPHAVDYLMLPVPKPRQILHGVKDIDYPDIKKFQIFYKNPKDFAIMTSVNPEVLIAMHKDKEDYIERIYGKDSNNELPLQENEQDYFQTLCSLQDECMSLSQSTTVIPSELEEYFELILHQAMLLHRCYLGEFPEIASEVSIGGHFESLDIEESPDADSDGLTLDFKWQSKDDRRGSGSIHQIPKGLHLIKGYINSSKSKYPWPEFIVKALRWGERKPKKIIIEGIDQFLDMTNLTRTSFSGNLADMTEIGSAITEAYYMNETFMDPERLQEYDRAITPRFKNIWAFKVETIYEDDKGNSLVIDKYKSLDCLVREIMNDSLGEICNITLVDGKVIFESKEKIKIKHYKELYSVKESKYDVSPFVKQTLIELGVTSRQSELVFLPNFYQMAREVTPQNVQQLMVDGVKTNRDLMIILADLYLKDILEYITSNDGNIDIDSAVNSYMSIVKKNSKGVGSVKEPERIPEPEADFNNLEVTDEFSMNILDEVAAPKPKVHIKKGAYVPFKGGKKLYIKIEENESHKMTIYHEDRVDSVEIEQKSKYSIEYILVSVLGSTIKDGILGKDIKYKFDRESLNIILEELGVLWN